MQTQLSNWPFVQAIKKKERNGESSAVIANKSKN